MSLTAVIHKLDILEHDPKSSRSRTLEHHNIFRSFQVVIETSPLEVTSALLEEQNPGGSRRLLEILLYTLFHACVMFMFYDLLLVSQNSVTWCTKPHRLMDLKATLFVPVQANLTHLRPDISNTK
ncbi:hypothetical protein Pcinc_034742 [Petrolisthes cinctipes]|uniref:Uncharacterized protein n=1 Tax=Petrolisthes cinctipes TaxID=88211 RepID=A0AAE1BY51_PETCI|nr:hypothetical protein Pcinc_034742 [Petrolisthes cinctipes]